LWTIYTYSTPINRITIGFGCCAFGGIGLFVLWIKLSHNFLWLLSSIFIPGMFNGLAGLISTFVSIYGSQEGVHYGATTIATLAATGGCAVICGLLTGIYLFKVFLVERRHALENALSGNASTEK
jgi:hypothetical protein